MREKAVIDQRADIRALMSCYPTMPVRLRNQLAASLRRQERGAEIATSSDVAERQYLLELETSL